MAELLPPSLTCLVDLLSLFSTLSKAHLGVVAFGESFPEVLFLLLEQLRIAAHGGGPMGEGLDDTVVDESLSSFKPMYCSREYQASTRSSQQYEKSTPNQCLP